MPHRTTVIISAGRSDDPTPRTLERDLVSALKNRPDVDVALIGHLYDLPPDGPGAQYLQSVAGDMIVLGWLYPRATYWTLEANGVRGCMGTDEPAAQTGDVPDRTIWCLDLNAHDDAKPLLEQIERIVANATGQPAASGDHDGRPSDEPTPAESIARLRWYPVVDCDRCQNCMECMNFCLFGVFGLDESGRLFVEQPDACRDGCPACARVCPSQAIIFPHHNSPAIAGDPAASAAGFNTGLVQLLGAPSPEQLAATERDRALAEMAEADQRATKDDLDRLVDELDEMES